MSAAREEVLARVRGALTGADPRPLPPPGYRRRGERAVEQAVLLFAERCAGYRATVRLVAATELAAEIEEVLRRWGARRLAVPPDLPAEWRVDGVEWVADRDLPLADLDDVDGVLTGCALAIAETGTIALDGGSAQGRRTLTLVPDRHLCVVRSEQVVELVPEAVERLGASAAKGAPITLIAGPSATSDIELQRVEGVHGPRVLDVLVVG